MENILVNLYFNFLNNFCFLQWHNVIKYNDNGFLPIFYLLYAVNLIFFLIIILIVITSLLGLLLAIVSFGIFSNSVIVSISYKSSSIGFRTFIYWITIFIALLTSNVFLFSINHFYGNFNIFEIMSLGIIIGCLSGFVSGKIINFYFVKVFYFLKKKLYKILTINNLKTQKINLETS